MKNPELNAIKNIDSERRHNEIERIARDLLPDHRKAEKYLQSVAIDPSNLEDYDQEVVLKDLEHAEIMRSRMHARHEEQRIGNLTGNEVKKLADILEYLIHVGINKHDWLPFCNAIKTSDYDDITNGVDLVIEYHNAERFGHLGLGVDVTFSKNLDRKFARIKQEIDDYDGKRNRLGEVKYFQSNRSGISGRLFGMPRVVAALDLAVMKDLSTNMQPNHVASHAIVVEMQHQLEVFREYAERSGSGCVDQLTRAHGFMTNLSNGLASEKRLTSSDYHKNDRIQDAVESGLDIFR